MSNSQRWACLLAGRNPAPSCLNWISSITSGTGRLGSSPLGLGAGSTIAITMRFPSGDQRNPAISPSTSVNLSASPPRRSSIQIWPRSSLPRMAVNAIICPSGLNWGAPASVSGSVSARGAPPGRSASHMRELCLSAFSSLVVAIQAAVLPSGLQPRPCSDTRPRMSSAVTGWRSAACTAIGTINASAAAPTSAVLFPYRMNSPKSLLTIR